MLYGASAAKQRASEHASGRLITSRGWRKATAGQARRCTPASHHRLRISPPTQRTPETSTRQEQFEWWAHLVGALRVHPHKYCANYPPQKDRGTARFGRNRPRFWFVLSLEISGR